MKNITMYPSGSQTAAADATSVSYDLGDLANFAIHVDFTGGAGNLAGSLILQCSNDDSDYMTVADSTQAITSSASHTWNVNGAGYRYVRVKWTFTSGTGNITARLIAKETVVKGG